MVINCFGIARDICGAAEFIIEGDTPTTVYNLRKLLNDKYPELSKIKSYMIAVNEKYALDEDTINNNDEIAIIPPVSGG